MSDLTNSLALRMTLTQFLSPDIPVNTPLMWFTVKFNIKTSLKQWEEVKASNYRYKEEKAMLCSWTQPAVHGLGPQRVFYQGRLIRSQQPPKHLQSLHKSKVKCLDLLKTGDSDSQESSCSAEDGFNPWTGKIPCRILDSHSSILAGRIPQTKEPGRLESMGSQKVGHDWATNTFVFIYILHYCLILTLPRNFTSSFLYTHFTGEETDLVQDSVRSL